jgi:hypothetical protein
VGIGSTVARYLDLFDVVSFSRDAKDGSKSGWWAVRGCEFDTYWDVVLAVSEQQFAGCDGIVGKLPACDHEDLLSEDALTVVESNVCIV